MHSSSCLVLTLLSFGLDAVLHAQSSQSLLPPLLAKAFLPFAAKVKVHFDARWLYIESDGMPDHEMMTGIRAWQQQVPLPQPFTGDNAWQVPIKPVPSAMPMSVKTGFSRGDRYRGERRADFQPDQKRREDGYPARRRTRSVWWARWARG